MKQDNLPFTVKELKVAANDLLLLGVKKEKLSVVLKDLLKMVVTGSLKNDEKSLLSAAAKMINC